MAGRELLSGRTRDGIATRVTLAAGWLRGCQTPARWTVASWRDPSTVARPATGQRRRRAAAARRARRSRLHGRMRRRHRNPHPHPGARLTDAVTRAGVPRAGLTSHAPMCLRRCQTPAHWVDGTTRGGRATERNRTSAHWAARDGDFGPAFGAGCCRFEPCPPSPDRRRDQGLCGCLSRARGLSDGMRKGVARGLVAEGRGPETQRYVSCGRRWNGGGTSPPNSPGSPSR